MEAMITPFRVAANMLYISVPHLQYSHSKQSQKAFVIQWPIAQQPADELGPDQTHQHDDPGQSGRQNIAKMRYLSSNQGSREGELIAWLGWLSALSSMVRWKGEVGALGR